MSSNDNNNEQSPPKRPPRKNNLKILEKYKIIKELGRGAFGAALLVTRHTDNKNFVMKKIDLQNMPPQEKKAAEIEVNVLKKLKHQNIVKYVNEVGGRFFKIQLPSAVPPPCFNHRATHRKTNIKTTPQNHQHSKSDVQRH